MSKLIKNAVLDLRLRQASVIFNTVTFSKPEKKCAISHLHDIQEHGRSWTGRWGRFRPKYGRETLRMEAEGGITTAWLISRA